MAESQIPTYSEATNAIEVPYESGTAFFYIANGSTLTVVYNSLVHTIAGSVVDYAAMKVDNGTNEYFVIYILSNGDITRYDLFLFNTGYNMVHDLDVVSGAISLDFHQVTDTQHSISYLENDSIHYIAFTNALGVEYFWDKEDTRVTNQIEFDTGDVVGIYMVDGTENVNVEEYSYQQPFAVVTPTYGESLAITVTIDTEFATLDKDNAIIYVNDVEVDYTRTDDDFVIKFNPAFAIYDDNTVEITDNTFTYSDTVKLVETFINRPNPKPAFKGKRGIQKPKTTGTLIEKFGGRGKFDLLGSPGVRERVRTRIKPK